MNDDNTVLDACREVDSVMHIASNIDVRLFPNEKLTHNVKVKGVKRLIYCSSMDVVIGRENIFDGNEENARLMGDHENLFPVYGPSKAAAEKLALSANSPALRTLALRPVVLYGELDKHTFWSVVKIARILESYIRIDSSAGVFLYAYVGNEEMLSVNSFTGSMNDDNTVLDACREVDSVMHIASNIDVRLFPNEKLTHNVKIKGVKRLIYCSSMDVVIGRENIFDGNEENARLMGDHENLFPVYGPSKAAAEKLALSANSPALRTLALRPVVLYGELDKHTFWSVVKIARILESYIRIDSSAGVFLYAYVGNEEMFSVNSFTGSVSDYNTVLEACREVESVMHIASNIDARLFPYEKLTHDVNVKGTETMIRACKEAGVKRLIYCSSIDVVIDRENIYDGYEENTRLMGNHENLFPVYGPSEASAEKLALSANSPAFRTMALRPAVLYRELERRTFWSMVKTDRKLGRYIRIDSSAGVVPYAYVRNIAWAFICTDKTLMKEDENAIKASGKAYFIADDTPRKHMFDFIDSLMIDAGTKPFPFTVPLWFFIYMMHILVFILWLLRFVLNVNLSRPKSFSAA